MPTTSRSKDSNIFALRQIGPSPWIRPRKAHPWFLLGLLLLLAVKAPAAPADDAGIPDYSVSGKYFPQIFRPYMQQRIPPPDLNNTKTLTDMIREGKIELSLRQLEAAVLENNLDIAVARFNYFFAQADLLRAKSGQASRGVPGAPIPDQIFAGALGTGTGSVGAAGGIGATGSITGQVRTINLQSAGLYDPYLIFNYNWDRTTTPLNTERVAGLPSVTPPTMFIQFYFQQAFTQGGNINLSISNQRQSSNQQGLLYNPEVITRLSFSGVQPLINGNGFAFNRIFLDVSRNGIQIVRQEFRQQVAAILAQAETSYWDMATAQAQVRAAEQALAVAQQLDDENEKRYKAGVLAEVDANNAEAEVAARRRDLIIVQTNLQYSEVALKNLFSRQITDAIGSAQIVTTDPLPAPAEGDIPPLEQAVAIAVENRPEIPVGEGNIKNQQMAVSFTHNGLRPTLNLFGLFALAGLSGNRFLPNPEGEPPILVPGGLAQELTQIWRTNYPEYAFGLGVSIPLRNRAAQADNARAQLNERQAEVALQQTRKSIGLDVRNAIISLNQAKAQVQAAITAAEFSRQNRDAEEKKLQAGVSTSYNLILAERDMLTAKLAEAQARGTYAKAIVNRDLVEGVTLENSHFTLEDALRGRIVESSSAAPVR